jgi:hypothetical protein
MNETLRPSTLGEILDRTVQLYRRNFWLFAGTAALPFAAIFAVALVAVPFGVFAIPGVAGSASSVTSMIGGAAVLIAVLIALPVYLALYVYAVAGITQAAVATHRGEKLTIRAALRSVRPRFWTYFGFLLLQGLIAALVPGVAAGSVIFGLILLGARAGMATATGIGIVFLVVIVGAAAVFVILWLAMSYAMGMAVCVAEQKPAWESLQRALDLSKGTRLRIFVMFLLIIVLSMAASTIGYILSLLTAAVASLAGNSSSFAIIAAAVSGVVYAVLNLSAQIVLQPVSWIALVLFYYDQRIRKEGFDIEWMMQRAGMTDTLTLPVAPATLINGSPISTPAPPPDTVEER